MKRIAAVVTMVGALFAVAAPAAMAATPSATGQVCVQLNVNGSDLVNQCISQ
jgi:hypothetical protein